MNTGVLKSHPPASIHARTAPKRNGINVVVNFGIPESSTQPDNASLLSFIFLLSLHNSSLILPSLFRSIRPNRCLFRNFSMISARSSFGVVYVIAGTRNSLEIVYTSELCSVNIIIRSPLFLLQSCQHRWVRPVHRSLFAAICLMRLSGSRAESNCRLNSPLASNQERCLRNRVLFSFQSLIVSITFTLFLFGINE